MSVRTFVRAGWAIQVNGTLACVESCARPSVYDTLEETDRVMAETSWLASDKRAVFVKVFWDSGEYSYEIVKRAA